MNNNTKTNLYNGYSQTVVELDGIKVTFMGGKLICVTSNGWSFAVSSDNNLINPSRFPLSIDEATLQVIPDAIDLNKKFEKAKAICAEALAKYLASPNYAKHLELHRQAFRLTKTIYFDGHCQAKVELELEAVEFTFLDGHLLSIECVLNDDFRGKWPFEVTSDNDLINPTGWPRLTNKGMLTFFPDAIAQNEAFKIAKDICAEALAKYLSSLDYTITLELHQQACLKR